MSRVYTNTDTKQNAELLCDIKKYDNGREKEQPWRPKKVRTLVLADCFAALGEEKRAERIRYCGTNLQFRQNIASGKKRLTAANFCKERLCPMCGWRRSIKMYNQVSRIMDWCDEQRADLLPIFLTLTVRNCSGEELGATLDSLFSAWKKLMQRRNIKRQIVGWFRALEVTYSEKERNWHPHFHVILLVEKSYFSKSNSEYLRTSDWVKAWRESLQIDYDPVCDARRAGKDGRRKKAVAEVAKYTMKDTDYLPREKDEATRRVGIIFEALRGRRLYAFGGLMNEAKKALKLKDVETSDLILTDAKDETAELEEIRKGDLVQYVDKLTGEIREDLAEMVLHYSWSFDQANYIRRK